MQTLAQPTTCGGARMTPGQIAYTAWWQALNEHHSLDLFHDEWAEITEGARIGWEAAARAVISAKQG